MQPNQISLSIVRSGIFLVCLIAGARAFISKWTGSPSDEIIDIALGKKDNRILYGIYREIKRENDIKEEVELRLREPGRENSETGWTYTLHPEKEWDIMNFSPLGLSSVLMMYYNNVTDKVEFLIMNLELEKSFPVQTDEILDEDFGDIIFYDDYFDILVRNKTLCGNSETCLISFNDHGKRFGKPQPFEALIKGYESIGAPWVPALSAESPKKLKGYYHELWNPVINVTTVSFLNQDGTEITSFEAQDGLYVATSSDAGLYSTCGMDYEMDNSTGVEKLSKYVKCSQFNPSTKKLVTYKPITVEKNAVSLAVTNTAGGGFLFSTAVVKNLKKAHTASTFNLIKVEYDGKVRQYEPLPLNLTCGDCSGRLLSNEINQIGQEFCVSFSCEYNWGKNHTYTYYNKCLGLADLGPEKQ